jgi:hypothetical protein
MIVGSCAGKQLVIHHRHVKSFLEGVSAGKTETIFSLGQLVFSQGDRCDAIFYLKLPCGRTDNDVPLVILCIADWKKRVLQRIAQLKTKKSVHLNFEINQR